jgi:hypothetical protein
MTALQFICRVRQLRAMYSRLLSLEECVKRELWDGPGSNQQQKDLLTRIENARIEARWAMDVDLN